MKTVLVIEPGTISKSDKAKLEKTDFLVIEHKNPADIRILFEGLDNDLLLSSSLSAINTSSLALDNFGREVIKRILNRKA